MPVSRSDSARNRRVILDAARAMSAEGAELQLNAVARRAGVGVGTVYRHFAAPEALAEGLAEQRFVEMINAAGVAGSNPNAYDALRGFLTGALRVYVADPIFAAAVMTTDPVLKETRELRAALLAAFSTLVNRAAGHLTPELEPVDFMILICGLSYSARLRPERTDRYLNALLDGILVEHTGIAEVPSAG